MKQASLKSVQPVLPSQDAAKSISYYVDKLGFTIAFQDNEANPTYAGVVRDQVEIHFQWHDPKEWEAAERPMIRFVGENIDELYQEYSTQDVSMLTPNYKRRLGALMSLRSMTYI